MTDAEARELMRLSSELASERATTAGLRAELERTKAEAHDGFRQLIAQRDQALAEVRRLKGPGPTPAPNLPPVRE